MPAVREALTPGTAMLVKASHAMGSTASWRPLLRKHSIHLKNKERTKYP